MLPLLPAVCVCVCVCVVCVLRTLNTVQLCAHSRLLGMRMRKVSAGVEPFVSSGSLVVQLALFGGGSAIGGIIGRSGGGREPELTRAAWDFSRRQREAHCRCRCFHRQR